MGTVLIILSKNPPQAIKQTITTAAPTTASAATPTATFLSTSRLLIPPILILPQPTTVRPITD